MLIFKTPALQKDFETLKSKNQALAVLMEDLGEFIHANFGKDIVVTDLHRTRKQMEAIYGKGTKRTSPHERWQAVDIRDWIYDNQEKQTIIGHLKNTYDSINRLAPLPSQSRTVLMHNMGKGMHFHIQYSGPVMHVYFDAPLRETGSMLV
jgi:hypothetical protein